MHMLSGLIKTSLITQCRLCGNDEDVAAWYKIVKAIAATLARHATASWHGSGPSQGCKQVLDIAPCYYAAAAAVAAASTATATAAAVRRLDMHATGYG